MLRRGFYCPPQSVLVTQSSPYHQANESTEQQGEDPDSKHSNNNI